jgi:hypothetical protein
MNLVIQNNLPDMPLRPLLEAGGSDGPSHEFVGAVRNLHRAIGARHTPYGAFQINLVVF